MNYSGANQTTPIVHNGIIYLASPSNIVQALNGKTGELIWETRVGPDQAPGYGGIRSIAIAEDKVFLPTSDAHMVALNARNGQILWDTPVSDKAHPSTSGAIVIKDKVLMGLTGCASQPPPVRMVHRNGGWTPETIAEVAMPSLASGFTSLDSRNTHAGLPME